MGDPKQQDLHTLLMWWGEWEYVDTTDIPDEMANRLRALRKYLSEQVSPIVRVSDVRSILDGKQPEGVF